MRGIIEKRAKLPVTICQQPVISDGKTTYQREIAARGLLFDFSQDDFDYFGTIKNGKIFLIAPLDAPPEVPGQIVYEGRCYDIKQVKTYRNLKMQVLGYRIAVAGA